MAPIRFGHGLVWRCLKPRGRRGAALRIDHRRRGLAVATGRCYKSFARNENNKRSAGTLVPDLLVPIYALTEHIMKGGDNAAPRPARPGGKPLARCACPPVSRRLGGGPEVRPQTDAGPRLERRCREANRAPL